MSHGIQSQVAVQPGVAVEGGFASTNPHYSVDAGAGGLVAGPNGLVVGRFAWLSTYWIDGDGAPAAANNNGSGQPAGIVPRTQQGLITTYLSNAGMTTPAGFAVTVISAGDMWVRNNGAGQALPGMKAYADYATGQVTFAATGSPTTASGSASSVAAATSSVTGSIAGNVLNVTAIGSGTLYPGTTISGTGVASGTVITGQLSGTAGGIGTYSVSIPEQTVASTTISGTYGILTVGGTVAGTFVVGDTITGSSVVTGTTITALISGTGGAGTYVVNNNTVVSSTAITAANNIETNWTAQSAGLTGELVKITRLP